MAATSPVVRRASHNTPHLDSDRHSISDAEVHRHISESITGAGKDAQEQLHEHLGPENIASIKSLHSHSHHAFKAETWTEEWSNTVESRDQTGEAMVHDLSARLRSEGHKFIDAHFPPNVTSLRKAGGGAASQGTRDDFLSDVRGEVVWKRPGDIGLKALCHVCPATLSGSPEPAGKVRPNGDWEVGHEEIRQLIDAGNWTEDTELFFPYRADGWDGSYRRWGECKTEFVGFGENPFCVWSDEIDPDDIEQGCLADCWFLAACANIAMPHEDYLVRDLIVEQGADVGLYACKFFTMGKWASFVVDDFFPCSVSNGILGPCFCKMSTQGEIWSMLLEKAFAKLHGSYQALALGHAADALNYLSGGFVDEYDLSTGEHSADDMWNTLRNSVPLEDDSRASFMSCALCGSITQEVAASQGLVTGHAYSLLGVCELSTGVKILKLRNPHGHGGAEWTGAFSDGDAVWTPELRTEVLNLTHDAIAANDDGSFFMSWEDFQVYFTMISECNPWMTDANGDRHDIKCNSVLGEWIHGHSAGGKHGLETFAHNPSYALVPQDSSINITLFQPDKRALPKSVPFIDMCLYLVEDGQAIEKDAKPLMAMSSRYCYKAVDVKPGQQYTLIPCAWGPGVEGHFCITISSKSGVQLDRLPKPCRTREHARKMVKARSRSALCYCCAKPFSAGVSYYDVPEGRLHSECMDTYRAQTAEKCLHCKRPLLGQFFKYDAGSVHAEGDCQQQYEISVAPKCLVCHGPVLGGFYELEGGKVHAEGDCYENYKLSKAPKCAACGEPVQGSYYERPEGKVHADEGSSCWVEFQQGKRAPPPPPAPEPEPAEGVPPDSIRGSGAAGMTRVLALAKTLKQLDADAAERIMKKKQKASPAATAAPVSLSGGWVEKFSEQHQRPYYVHRVTKKSVWVKPVEAGDEAEEEGHWEEKFSEQHQRP